MNNIFYANIDDAELGLTAVSLVECPAIEANFVCFEEEKKPMMFADQSKHIITGPAIIADKPIIRYDHYGDPYYIVFTADVIEKMVHKFAKSNLLNMVDLQHDGKAVDGIVMVESFIKNTPRGICPTEFTDVKDGSWFISYKVEDEALWQNIINSNQLNGFSIECMIDLIPERFSTPQSDLDKYIDEILN